MRLVLDASYLVRLVSDEERSAALDPLIATSHELHVPAICDAEVVGGLARHVRMRRGSPDDARASLVDYVSLPLTRHMHVTLVARLFELTTSFSASDASYVALAEALDASLVTLDAPLRQAVRRHTAVEVLP
jgi:predicted nucleic acid-binding protein